LFPGRNTLEVKADNGISWNLAKVELSNPNVERAGKKPDLWLLAIGINRYYYFPADKSLPFAPNDALKIEAAFKAQEGIRYGAVHTRLITDKSFIVPTADNIKANLDFFKDAGKDDLKVLFLSGHGFEEEGTFYFVPADAKITGGNIYSGGNISREKTITSEDFIRLLSAGGGRKLILIDACHSGGIGNDNADSFIRSLWETKSAVFSSSSLNESSYADLFLGSIFTRIFVDGAKGPADTLPEAGIISIREMEKYIKKEVPPEAEKIIIDGKPGRQNPYVYYVSDDDFAIFDLRKE
jgi:hypothetical protein